MKERQGLRRISYGVLTKVFDDLFERRSINRRDSYVFKSGIEKVDSSACN